MRKKKLLVDFDDVICDNSMVRKVNEFLQKNYKIEELEEYIVDDVIPKNRKEEFYDFIGNKQNDFYKNAHLIEGAKDSLLKLSDKYDVYICSSCIVIRAPEKSATVFADKYNFLLKFFPFLEPSKFIFTSSKYLVKGDIMIDDSINNLKTSICKHKFLFDAYHNRKHTDKELKKLKIKRVKTWEEILSILS